MELKLELKLTDDKQLEETYQKSLLNLSQLQEQAKQENTEGLAWFNWPEKGGFTLLDKLQSKLDQISFYYDLVVVIGIGGSYLGTKAVDGLFGVSSKLENNSNHRKPILFIGNNLSENYLLKSLSYIKERNPVFCVVSKSGKTVEPIAAYCTLEDQLTMQYSKTERAERTFFITDEKENPLHNKSKEEKQNIITIPTEMGGRFSVMSAASLFPLLLAGHKISQLMQGAHTFFKKLKTPAKNERIASAQYASARFLAWSQNKRIELLAYNEPSLSGLASWWQQLFAESEGKESKGLFPTSSLFSTDLHSLGQYLQEGCPSIFETFLLYEDYSALGLDGPETRLRIPSNKGSRDLLEDKCGHYFFDLNQKIMEAAQRAHEESGVPYCKITLGKLTEFNLGYLLGFFQTACTLSAKLLEVNPFDQPGVEVYKKELKELTMTP